jgi:hypothetical protein
MEIKILEQNERLDIIIQRMDYKKSMVMMKWMKKPRIWWID